MQEKANKDIQEKANREMALRILLRGELLGVDTLHDLWDGESFYPTFDIEAKYLLILNIILDFNKVKK